MTMIIGLTGGIATGKSTVAQMFIDSEIPLIDADTIAHEVMERGTPVHQQIVDTFGDDVLMSTGHIHRPRLAEMVFNDAVKREKLNKIVHPAVLEEIEYLLSKMDDDVPLVVLDVPLLFEAKVNRRCDRVIVVSTDTDIQLERLMKRDDLSEHDALKRIASQMPLEEKVALADYVIDNSHSVIDTKKQFKYILNQLLEEVNTHGDH